MNHETKHQKIEFNEENERRFQHMLPHYPTRDAALIPSLHLLLEQYGELSHDVISYIAGRLELPLSRVLSVGSFYTMLNRDAHGRYHIQVCRTLSCALAGSEQLLEHLEKRLGIKVGETTSDGKFTLSAVECLAACGTGPAMQINNDDYLEQLTVEKVDEILARLS